VKVYEDVENYLNAQPSRSKATCDPILDEAVAAEQGRLLLQDIDESVVEPWRDHLRTACFLVDAQGLERSLAFLLDRVLESAQNCKLDEQDYFAMAERVASALVALRRYGLDPRFTSGGVLAPAAPLGASTTDDDAICPYNASYASGTFGEGTLPSGSGVVVGCTYSLLPPTPPETRLHRETSLFDRLTRHLDTATGFGSLLQRIRTIYGEILAEADRFLTQVRRGKPLRPPPARSVVFTPRPFPNALESGCLGWPSGPAGLPVSGSGFTLHASFSPLTEELEEAIAYLLARSSPLTLEYVRDYEERVVGGAAGLGQVSYREALVQVNEEHQALESSLILTLRDPQQRMEKVADGLHARTRELARQIVVLPDQAEDPPTDGPPFRHFLRRYATFLSRMCINRGCEKPLLRTIELSLRDECFSATLLDLFFQGDPSATTLKACRSRYVGR
jgi:hypothetical protein